MNTTRGTSPARLSARCFAITWLFLAVSAFAGGEALTADLGAGLHFTRLADASDAAPIDGTGVIDLRFTLATEESAAGLAARLRRTAESGATLFILVNSETEPLLGRKLAGVQSASRSVVFIGPVTPELVPDLVTSPDPAEERKAIDAVVSGVSPTELIVEKIEKPRLDEAHLVRSRANGNTAPANDNSDPQPAGSGTPPGRSETQPVLPRDVSLQRAVFLHRALVALGRIHPAA